MGKVQTNWIGLPPDFSPEDWEGFVYLITCTLTQRKYIGRKYFWSKRKKKQKGKKRRKLVCKESDWRYYLSSCEELKKDILKYGRDKFIFAIVSLHRTRSETNYSEVKEMFQRDVLYSRLGNGLYEFYNLQILNRYWRQEK